MNVSFKKPGAEKKLRILQCFRAPVGGLFRHVCDLAKAQAAAGHDVGIICDSTTGGDQGKGALEALSPHCKLGVHRIAMPRQIGFRDGFAVREIAQKAIHWNIDVLHGHGAKGGAYARLARFAGHQTPLRFYTPHGGSLHYSRFSPQGMIFLNLERLLLARTDGLIFESKYAETTFRSKIGYTNIDHRVVFNGLTETDFLTENPAGQQADLLYVGELRELKGVATLLSALGKLRDRGLKPSLLIVGAGPDEKKFRDLCASLHLDSQVEFAGAMPARKAFSRAGALIVPSHKESLPYIVLEAAAAKIPLIATDVGGIPEIFGPLADRLVPPQNDEALATAIQYVLEQSDACVTSAAELRERVRVEFSATKMARQILGFYAEKGASAARSVASPDPVTKKTEKTEKNLSVLTE